MTIAKTSAKKQYAGDGTTTAFSFPYRFFDDSDLEIYILDASDVETLKTLTTDYTVSNAGDETGGTVTMVTAPLSGETLTILRSIPDTQSVDYAANDAFPAETHEQALDRNTLLVQQAKELSGRALIAPVSDTASLELPIDRASKFLAFDASKNPIASAGSAGTVPVSSFMATVLDDVDAPAARATLGAGTLNNVSEDTTPQLGGPLNTNSHPIDWSQGADVASAAELLVLRDGNSFDVTGTTTISSIETTADAWPVGSAIKLQFDGALTLTNGAPLVLLGGADITVAAGDWATFQKRASGVWAMSDFSGITKTEKDAIANLNPFGNALLHVTHEEASGTVGGVGLDLAWNTRTLNTTKTNEIGATVASNQITLPAGDYYIEAATTLWSTGKFMPRLRDVTNAATKVIGVGGVTQKASYRHSGHESLTGRFTLAASTVLEVQSYLEQGASSTSTLGYPTSSGENEKYVDVKIWKL